MLCMLLLIVMTRENYDVLFGVRRSFFLFFFFVGAESEKAKLFK